MTQRLLLSWFDPMNNLKTEKTRSTSILVDELMSKIEKQPLLSRLLSRDSVISVSCRIMAGPTVTAIAWNSIQDMT